MKHETLSVDLDGDPLDIAIHFWVPHVDGNHESLDGSVVEWFSNGVIVEIAVDEQIPLLHLAGP